MTVSWAKLLSMAHETVDQKRCSKCHQLQPLTSFHKQAKRLDGLHIWCKSCSLDYNRSYRANPENNARRLAWRRENDKYDRNKRAAYLYGATDIPTLLAAQGGGCAICGASSPGGRWGTWHVDHDHACCESKPACGKCVRGLLCSTCNTGLGMFKDSPELLAKAAAYLAR
jgi:Recombination endonuclease VII